MNVVDLTILEADLTELRHLLMREDGVEAAAYVLCGESRIQSDPWEKQSRRRFTIHSVVPIPAKDAISASKRHITWSTDSYVKLLRQAKDKGLVPGIVHTHPCGPAHFSEQDDQNEKDLVQTARNRNGGDGRLISILLSGDSRVRARLWPELHDDPINAETVRIVGRQLKMHPLISSSAEVDFLARQTLAFGSRLNAQLQTMRVGVVGCGGTGSATAMLLARLGVGRLALFDKDIVDVTNLNRLHGAHRADADAMRPKTEVLAREITDLGIGVRVVPLQGWANEPHLRDALKSCDVIFSCTDDHSGRHFLNRLAHFYLIPVIDMGLLISRGSNNGIEEPTGRVTVLVPEAPCLLCRRIIDPKTIREEYLQRRSPEEYERGKREAYIQGGGDPAPAVVTFTTETACLAVNEFLQALTGFRSSEGWVWQRDRQFDLFEDRRRGAKLNENCPLCNSKDYWGRGDIEPFLDLTE